MNMQTNNLSELRDLEKDAENDLNKYIKYISENSATLNDEVISEIKKKTDKVSEIKAQIINEEKMEAEEIKRQEESKIDKLMDINWDWVIANAESEVNEIKSWEYHEDNDNAHYIYEAVMMAVYWDDYFKWKNKNT